MDANKERIAKIIAAAKEKTRLMLEQAQAKANVSALPSSAALTHYKDMEAAIISEMITIGGNTFNPYELDGLVLNEQQRQAVDMFGLQGKSGCLIGPAGTGKTTTTKAIVRAAIMCGRIRQLPDDFTHKYMRPKVAGIFGGSFTRIATRNLKKNMPEEIQAGIHTIHKLLEYEPDFKEITDIETGKLKKIRLFIPTRNAYRPLPPELSMFLLDESSMIGLTLHTHLMNAISASNKQMIYIGDIAQLPPVMDDAILGYKLQELPVVELTEVYRHAGVIVSLANHIRTGHTIPAGKAVVPYSANLRKMPKKLAEDAIQEWNREEDGSKVTIHLWKNRLEGEVGQLKALQNLNNFFKKEIESGAYDPLVDMILIPYNKAVGSIELNKYIAEYISKKAGQEVYEVIAGFEKHYFAVGDKVFYEREESVITKIVRNANYGGKIPQQHAVTLDRWGHNQAGRATNTDAKADFDSIDSLLNISIGEDDEERKNQGSHAITVKKLGDSDESGEEFTCSSAAEINNLLFGYALTIHKSQGSQWPKVYCIFHNSHNRNLQRESLYTAITRAQKELYVICEPETLIQGVISQHIVGNTLAQKAEYFKGKIDEKQKKKDLLANLTGGK